MVKKVLDDAPAQEAGAAEDRHLSDICHLTHYRATGLHRFAAAQALSGRLQAKLAPPAPEEQREAACVTTPAKRTRKPKRAE
jgi:hypothetical protein